MKDILLKTGMVLAFLVLIAGVGLILSKANTALTAATVSTSEVQDSTGQRYLVVTTQHGVAMCPMTIRAEKSEAKK